MSDLDAILSEAASAIAESTAGDNVANMDDFVGMEDDVGADDEQEYVSVPYDEAQDGDAPADDQVESYDPVDYKCDAADVDRHSDIFRAASAVRSASVIRPSSRPPRGRVGMAAAKCGAFNGRRRRRPSGFARQAWVIRRSKDNKTGTLCCQPNSVMEALVSGRFNGIRTLWIILQPSPSGGGVRFTLSDHKVEKLREILRESRPDDKLKFGLNVQRVVFKSPTAVDGIERLLKHIFEEGDMISSVGLKGSHWLSAAYETTEEITEDVAFSNAHMRALRDRYPKIRFNFECYGDGSDGGARSKRGPIRKGKERHRYDPVNGGERRGRRFRQVKKPSGEVNISSLE